MSACLCCCMCMWVWVWVGRGANTEVLKGPIGVVDAYYLLSTTEVDCTKCMTHQDPSSIFISGLHTIFEILQMQTDIILSGPVDVRTFALSLNLAPSVAFQGVYVSVLLGLTRLHACCVASLTVTLHKTHARVPVEVANASTESNISALKWNEWFEALKRKAMDAPVGVQHRGRNSTVANCRWSMHVCYHVLPPAKHNTASVSV